MKKTTATATATANDNQKYYDAFVSELSPTMKTLYTRPEFMDGVKYGHVAGLFAQIENNEATKLHISLTIGELIDAAVTYFKSAECRAIYEQCKVSYPTIEVFLETTFKKSKSQCNKLKGAYSVKQHKDEFIKYAKEKGLSVSVENLTKYAKQQTAEKTDEFEDNNGMTIMKKKGEKSPTITIDGKTIKLINGVIESKLSVMEIENVLAMFTKALKNKNK